MPPVLDTPERRKVAATLDAPPTTCPDPDCEGPTAWSLHARVSSHAPLEGRLRLRDVIPRLVLVCQDCGEPLWVIEDDGELGSYLEAITAERPPIVVEVVGRRTA